MKAIEYRKSIPRYAALKLAGRRMRGLYTSFISPVQLRDIDPPRLPGPSWVRVRPRLAGVCGSDLATITASGSPYLAPVISMPFVLGHETVGEVTEIGPEVADVRIGDRVVLHPALGCRVRGIEPKCPACCDGQEALCRNVGRGDISAGIQTGFCRDTGGAWSESLVAHDSQVYRVPEALGDPVAVLIEPLACAIHGVLRIDQEQAGTVLVVGCGTIGLLTIAALRALGSSGRIVAVAKHAHQRAHATRLGADEFLPSGGPIGDRYRAWAERLDAEVRDAELGKPLVIGGADTVFDCVASSSSLDDSIRFTRGGGQMVLVGMPGVPRGVDWTPLWYKELSLHAAYAYGPEPRDAKRRETFDIAIELAQRSAEALAPLVGDPYPLTDYRRALGEALSTGSHESVKTVFSIDSR